MFSSKKGKNVFNFEFELTEYTYIYMDERVALFYKVSLHVNMNMNKNTIDTCILIN